MNDRKPEVRYEDSAEVRTVSGWVCTACRRYWGGDEHMARYCCATSLPCECGERINPRSYTCCEACRRRKQDAKWASLERHEWDGETPLCEWDGDRFFYSPEDLESYLDEYDPGVKPEDLRLALCEPDNGRPFEMNEFLSDHLPEDGDDLDAAEIDKTVNDWIAAHSPLCWAPTNKAVSAESLAAHVRFPEPEGEPK